MHKGRKHRISVGEKDAAQTFETLYDAAIKALARRARSSGEIRALLARRKAPKADVEAVIHRLREHGYLDDARFARTFVASRIENRLEGKVRVRRDLAARRVKPEIAEEAVRRGFEDVDETKLLRQYLARKLRVSKPLNKPSAVQSLFRRLLRAGFRSDTIVGELKRLLRGPLSKAAAADEPVRWDEVLDSLPETPDPESEGG
jgi:regulatory protein